MVRAMGTGEGVRSTESLFFGNGGAPDGDRDHLFEPAGFFAGGEGLVFRRHAVGKIEAAADLLGRMNGAAGFAQQLGVRGRLSSNCLAVSGADHNVLKKGGAIEAGAGGFPLFALERVESGGGARDGEFGLGFLFFGAAEGDEIPEHALEGSLGSGLVAIEEG